MEDKENKMSKPSLQTLLRMELAEQVLLKNKTPKEGCDAIVREIVNFFALLAHETGQGYLNGLSLNPPKESAEDGEPPFLLMSLFSTAVKWLTPEHRTELDELHTEYMNKLQNRIEEMHKETHSEN